MVFKDDVFSLLRIKNNLLSLYNFIESNNTAYKGTWAAAGMEVSSAIKQRTQQCLYSRSCKRN